MQEGWKTIVQKVSTKKEISERLSPDDYEKRNYNYVRAMDQLVCRKAREIVKILSPDSWQAPILDVGGGAGSFARILSGSREENVQADLIDLPETIKAAKEIYNNPDDWKSVTVIEGDFCTYDFHREKKYGLIILSNFLHAYGEDEAKNILNKAVSLLKPDGIILIHDYFPDRPGKSPQKGPIYDLNMMLNTYNGMCHETAQIIKWLELEGMKNILIRDLETDTSVIAVSATKGSDLLFTPSEAAGLKEWVYYALKEGFSRAELILAKEIITGSWVRKKCECGCPLFGNNLQCPPNGMNSEETKNMLKSYSWGIVLEGMPPGKKFHKKLLALERKAFLNGFHKAFVFGAGHCPVCDECPKDDECRFPDRARPSMEGSGIDVYETVKKVGINLKPVTDSKMYVKYIGLLMLK